MVRHAFVFAGVRRLFDLRILEVNRLTAKIMRRNNVAKFVRAETKHKPILLRHGPANAGFERRARVCRRTIVAAILVETIINFRE